jgi:glyoxylase-like metal-dependent hydrolase (beta-lactamase superfamily II)
VVLVESGPGSTLSALQSALASEGYSARDVTHLLLTHIHLDHAGAAGWLARQGAEVYVHPVGAPHLLNPEKLLASASRIYGDRMDSLWGEFLSVPEDRLRVAEDAQEIVIGNLRFLPIDTPGHAYHHYAYLFEDVCFTGDIGGVRIPGFPYMRVPMPPPELHLEKWRESSSLRAFMAFTAL